MSTLPSITLTCHEHECPHVFVGNFREAQSAVVKRARQQGWRVGWFFNHCPQHAERPSH